MHRRIDAFELWCWRRLLRVPWTARRSNQSILKEISPEYSLEGLMLKLKLQYFGYLMRRTDSLEKTVMLGKIEGGKRRGRQRIRWLDGITNSMDMSLSKPRVFDVGQGSLACYCPWGRKELDMTEWLNWTELLVGSSSSCPVPRRIFSSIPGFQPLSASSSSPLPSQVVTIRNISKYYQNSPGHARHKITPIWEVIAILSWFFYQWFL